ncbi:hypothetical protein ACLOJK_037708 [Asimina triloba]
MLLIPFNLEDKADLKGEGMIEVIYVAINLPAAKRPDPVFTVTLPAAAASSSSARRATEVTPAPSIRQRHLARRLRICSAQPSAFVAPNEQHSLVPSTAGHQQTVRLTHPINSRPSADRLAASQQHQSTLIIGEPVAGSTALIVPDPDTHLLPASTSDSPSDPDTCLHPASTAVCTYISHRRSASTPRSVRLTPPAPSLAPIAVTSSVLKPIRSQPSAVIRGASRSSLHQAKPSERQPSLPAAHQKPICTSPWSDSAVVENSAPTGSHPPCTAPITNIVRPKLHQRSTIGIDTSSDRHLPRRRRQQQHEWRRRMAGRNPSGSRLRPPDLKKETMTVQIQRKIASSRAPAIDRSRLTARGPPGLWKETADRPFIADSYFSSSLEKTCIKQRTTH